MGAVATGGHRSRFWDKVTAPSNLALTLVFCCGVVALFRYANGWTWGGALVAGAATLVAFLLQDIINAWWYRYENR